MADITDNLADLIRAYLTPEVIDKAATFLGENRGATEKAMNTAVPALLSAFSKFAGSNTGANRLFELVKDADASDLFSTASSLFTSNKTTDSRINAGKSLLDTVLGNKRSSFVDSIAESVGMKTSSILSLLSMIGTFILGFLRKQVNALGLNAASLGHLLTEQSGSFTRLLPASLASSLGFDDGASASKRADNEISGIWKWLLPLLLLLGALILAIIGLKGCCNQQMMKLHGKALSSITLPDGMKLMVTEGGFDYNLFRFLKNQADTTVPRTFVFDDLNFEFNSSNLTPESKKTVDDLIIILRAFPTTEARLEGHTDNVGDAAINLKVSKDRSNMVKQLLVNAGIVDNRLTTNGYGQDRPIDTNDTEAGRARNRRTELVVTKK